MIAKKELRGEYTWYINNFSSLSDLYNYLKKNPKVNFRVFGEFYGPNALSRTLCQLIPQLKLYRLESEKKDERFYGLDYQTSLECLVGNLEPSLKVNMEKFLAMSKQLETKYKVSKSEYQRVKDFYGSVPDVNAYLQGRPKDMIRIVRTKEVKVVNIYFNLSYPHYTNEKQILYRGIIVINLIKLLEKSGYRVRFNTFMLAKKFNEVVYINLVLKNDSETLNIGKCFFPLCCKEFLRRIMLRTMESIDFKEKEWFYGYGDVLALDQMEKMLKLSEQDIMITYPEDMNISGDNLFLDASEFMDVIDLDKYVKVKR